MALPTKMPVWRFASQKNNEESKQLGEYVRQKIITSQGTVQPLRGEKC
jgi:hypothetical protein